MPVAALQPFLGQFIKPTHTRQGIILCGLAGANSQLHAVTASELFMFG